MTNFTRYCADWSTPCDNFLTMFMASTQFNILQEDAMTKRNERLINTTSFN